MECRCIHDVVGALQILWWWWWWRWWWWWWWWRLGTKKYCHVGLL